MARRLNDADIEAICKHIDGWDPKIPLTWEAVGEAVQALTGHRYTRQALFARQRIKLAYTVRTNVLKNLPERAPKGSLELRLAQDKIDGLKARIERLEAENNQLLSQYARWVYNAALHGLSKEKLNAPMPDIDRERTRRTLADERAGRPQKKGK
jgi:hypothetical protein